MGSCSQPCEAGQAGSREKGVPQAFVGDPVEGRGRRQVTEPPRASLPSSGPWGGGSPAPEGVEGGKVSARTWDTAARADPGRAAGGAALREGPRCAPPSHSHTACRRGRAATGLPGRLLAPCGPVFWAPRVLDTREGPVPWLLGQTRGRHGPAAQEVAAWRGRACPCRWDGAAFLGGG